VDVVKQIRNRQILDLMAQVEDLTGQCIGDYNEDLELVCIDALDGLESAPLVIRKLRIIIRELKRELRGH
jgi:hypothetical protein